MPGFHHSVSVLQLPFPYTVAVAAAVAVAYPYMPNGTEFSYVTFTEQRDFTTAERRNGNGRTATEWRETGHNSVHWSIKVSHQIS